jgi:antitoxin CptB
MGLYMPAPSPHRDMSPDLDPRRRRLLFRAHHRGTKEADLMVGGFVARHIAGLSEAELDSLEAVLEFPDVDLADWLSGRRPVPPECESPLLARMVAECGATGAGIPADARRA